MTLHFESGSVAVHHGDCLDVLRELPSASVHAVVTDPPYGLANTTPAQVAETLTAWISGDRGFIPSGSGFMGKPWDAFVPPVAVWDECIRVLKPGGHVLAFAGSRTVDLMTMGLRLAGLEIRDSIAWLYASGFPKSRNVSAEMREYLDRGPQAVTDPDRVYDSRLYEVTAFLRAARDAAGWTNARIDGLFGTNGMAGHWVSSGSQPACPSIRQWEILKAEIGFSDDLDDLVRDLAATERPEDWGTTARDDDTFLGALRNTDYDATHTDWGSALKPAFEPVVVARKPFTGSLGTNVIQHGTGGLHIAANRIAVNPADPVTTATWVSQESRIRPGTTGFTSREIGERTPPREEGLGRWPSNVLLDPHAATELDRQSGVTASAAGPVTYSQRKGGAGMGAAPRVAANADEVGRREVEAEGYGDIGGASRFFPVIEPDPRPEGRKREQNGVYEGGPLPTGTETWEAAPGGRWPPNVLLDDTAAAELDRQSGITASARGISSKAGSVKGNGVTHGEFVAREDRMGGYDDEGGASRFFPTFRYEAKAGGSERPMYALDDHDANGRPSYGGGAIGRVKTCTACERRRKANEDPCPRCGSPEWRWEEPEDRKPGFVAHPTVKPLSLMRWLVRLVTPPGGVVLEPFAGSGTTVEACALEGFGCIAIEREQQYLPLIMQRLGKPLEVGLDLGGWDPEAEARNAPPEPVPAARGKGSRRMSVAAATLDSTALDFGDWEAEA